MGALALTTLALPYLLSSHTLPGSCMLFTIPWCTMSFPNQQIGKVQVETIWRDLCQR